MVVLTFVIFIITCLRIIIINARMKDGALRAPTIVSLIVLLSIGPMMFQTIVNPVFDKDILPLFFLFICSCLICFHFGFKRGEKIKFYGIAIRQVEVGRNKFTSIVFCCLGVLALLAYQGKIAGFDWVVAGFLQSFGIISIFLSLTEIKECGLRNSKLYLLILIVASWCIIDYAFNIKGSRTRIFYIIIFFSLYLSRIYQYKSKLICKTFIYVMIIGSVASFSMGDYRSDMDKPFFDRINIKQIIMNFKINITGQNKISINGQDFYNGARYADYALTTSNYNYGLFIWNGLVFNYLPQRFVGQELKESMMCSLENRQKINQLTKGVTTVTGFGDAFAAFSIFGGIIFYVIAYYLGKWWNRSFYSDFYLLLYAYGSMYVAPMVTHGIIFFISPIIFFWVVIYPILKHSIYFTRYERTNYLP